MVPAVRIGTSGVLAAFVLAAAVSAAPAPQSPSAKSKAPSVVVLSGCVVADARKVFTLTDGIEGQTYRLTGTDMRAYVGQHVEILGAPPKRFRIVGGLYPSPNVAAQGGSIDPTKAAMAGQIADASAATPPVELKVKSIRTTTGTCPGR
jgi:hypothetical protein